MDPRTIRFPIAVLALALLPLLGWACSPPEGPYVPPGIETKIHFSDVVVHGEVTQRMDNKDFPESAYSVVMKVHCIFKADDDNFPAEITIVNAGYMPGLCHSTNLTVGKEYIVYLGKVGDKYEPRFSETVATQQTLQDFSFYCEVDIYYPDDYDEDMKKCPPAYPDYEDCIAYKPATEATTLMPPIPTKPSGPVAEPTPFPEAVPYKTTPKTEVRIVSNGNAVSGDQGHSVHTQHGPAKQDAVNDEEDDAQESVDPEGFRDDNGSGVPLVSMLSVAACFLVALLARA